MKIHLTIIFLLITPFLFAQVNLVPNPSFEDYTSCPDGLGQVYKANDWDIRINTPDYFNSCNNSIYSVPNAFFGYQNAATGSGICGLYVYNSMNPYGREFLGCKLIDTLIVGQKYFVSVKLNLPNTATCAVNKFGILFSTIQFIDTLCPYTACFSNNALILSNTIINDTLNWVQLKTSFMADSAYNYLTVGNFYENHLIDTALYSGNTCTSYYYIDDVCVSIDSLACNQPNAIIENSKTNKVNIFPNPATNELTIDFALTDKIYFELFDLMGAKRKAVTLDIGTQTKRIDLTDIDSGLYFYSVVDRKGNRIKTGKLVVIK